jgi:hypothetical protein
MPAHVNTCEPEPDSFLWKNVRIRAVHNYDGTPPHHWRVQFPEGTHEFAADEWDLTVEFKRKFTVGDHVHTMSDFGTGVIDAVSKSYSRPEYWVRRSDGSHMTYFAEQIKRVGDAG